MKYHEMVLEKSRVFQWRVSFKCKSWWLVASTTVKIHIFRFLQNPWNYVRPFPGRQKCQTEHVRECLIWVSFFSWLLFASCVFVCGYFVCRRQHFSRSTESLQTKSAIPFNRWASVHLQNKQAPSFKCWTKHVLTWYCKKQAENHQNMFFFTWSQFQFIFFSFRAFVWNWYGKV